MPHKHDLGPPLRLCLASDSPRRKQILESLGLNHYVISPTAGETHPTAPGIVEGVRANAVGKAVSVLDRMKGANDIALGADTLVVLDQEVMGKPKSPAEALQMVKRLSGRRHLVVTGIALVGFSGKQVSATEESQVFFRTISPEEMSAYVATREPHDKAGAYAVQGLGALFIERIEGSYTNVMGLPIEALLRELASFSQRSVFEWFQ